MMQSLRFAAAVMAAAAIAATTPAMAQAPANPMRQAELFYEVLLGELNAATDNDPGTSYALILDAARKTSDPQLFQRATDIALQARSGESALIAARAWKEALPDSREANRYVLQILVALNRTAETQGPLRDELARAPAQERPQVLQALPQLYARASDKAVAVATVEGALATALEDPLLGGPAWVTVGRMRLSAGNAGGALDAARRAQAMSPESEGPAVLALELMDSQQPAAEPIVQNYLAGKPMPEVRMAYARILLDLQRYSEARQQLQRVTTDKPEVTEAWLALGSVLAQEGQGKSAEAALQQYLERSTGDSSQARGRTQAYLQLAQIAEKRRDFAAAQDWLSRIENADDQFSVQARRASILAAQGKLDEARKLIQDYPASTPAQERARLMAEVDLLRNAQQYRAAYSLLEQAVQRSPEDTDLLYDQAMMAEKLGDFGNMETLLRRIIAAKPDYHNAYNALGYSMADRGERLPEARQLIQKALEYAPGDPFITDSLGWVEFRMGNHSEALHLLEGAYQSRPDPEIAAHLGEVLWAMGQYHRATVVWKEGLQRSADNETLRETIKRLKVRL